MKIKEDEGKKITYVKVESLMDLARLAFGSDFSSRNLFCYQKGSKYRIAMLGEHVANNIMAYYTDSDRKCKGILYESNDSGERAEASDADPGMEKGFIDVFEMDMGHMKEGSIDRKNIQLIKTGVDSLAKMAVKAAVHDEFIKHLYLFAYKGKQIIGGFELVEELNDDIGNFYYAVLPKSEKGNFIAYDYKTGKIEFTERIRGYSYMYLKIINLAEPFPFFNVPD